MSTSAQAESVIKNIIREICLECSSQGQNVSETLAAFMVSTCINLSSIIIESSSFVMITQTVLIANSVMGELMIIIY